MNPTQEQTELQNRFLEAGIVSVDDIDHITEWWRFSRLGAYLLGWRDLTPAELEILTIVYQQENHWAVRSNQLGEFMKVPATEGNKGFFRIPSQIEESKAMLILAEFAQSHGWRLLFAGSGFVIVGPNDDPFVSGQPAPTWYEAILRAYFRTKFIETFPVLAE